jgi:peptidoglycan hydrolase-like protein with peptidoglycan-binding domain
MADMNDPAFIRSVQQALKEKGFNAGPADGVMGPHTEAALRKFQSANRLQATGQLDSSTVAALGIASRYESRTAGSSTTTSRSGSGRSSASGGSSGG